MAWARLALWVPTAAVAALAAIACAGALLLPERATHRRYGLLAAALCGALAIAATVWQQQREAALLAAQQVASAWREASLTGTARKLHGAWRRFEAIAQLLPAAPGSGPAGSFDKFDDGFAALAAAADDLERRIKTFRVEAQGRSIDAATAAAMIAYLRPHGGHRVVVSCVPRDPEAYLYGNRIATILRRAGWDAVGPEATAIFGAQPAMGVGLYVRSDRPPEAAHLLVDAFTRFNIPYQSRIAPNAALPEDDTVELFIGKKP